MILFSLRANGVKNVRISTLIIQPTHRNNGREKLATSETLAAYRQKRVSRTHVLRPRRISAPKAVSAQQVAYITDPPVSACSKQQSTKGIRGRTSAPSDKRREGRFFSTSRPDASRCTNCRLKRVNSSPRLETQVRGEDRQLRRLDPLCE